MKRHAAGASILVLTAALAGCGQGEQSASASPPEYAAVFTPPKDFNLAAVGYVTKPVMQGKCVVTDIDPAYLKAFNVKPQTALLVSVKPSSVSATGIKTDPDRKEIPFGKASETGGFLITKSDPESAEFKLRIPAECQKYESFWYPAAP